MTPEPQNAAPNGTQSRPRPAPPCPGPAEARAELARLLNGHVVIGHNVGVD
jgi:hypothetical protein